MASGRVGAVKPTSATYTTLYKPSGAIAVVAVSLANQSTTDDTFRIAITQSASSNPTPATTDFVAYGAVVKGSGDTGFADRAMFGPFELNSANNDQIVVYSANGTTSFVATGDEGAA